MTKRKNSRTEDGLNIVRGFLMGGADAIPGVSGGTIALILGIYQQLITSVSRFDRQFIDYVVSRQWSAASMHINLRFLAALGCGIVTGILSLGELMNGLLSGERSRGLTLAVFFGMIVASSIIVARLIHAPSTRQVYLHIAIWIAGVAIAFGLTGTALANVEITIPYIFFCGVIAICAMILPGISGAYLLVILGLYLHLTSIAKSIRTLALTTDEIITLVVFASGCAVGILSFSKLLRWLLSAHNSLTMALLCGFMIGALRKIWPFQVHVTTAGKDLEEKLTRNIWPSAIDGYVLACIALAICGFICVFAMHRIARHMSVSTDDLM